MKKNISINISGIVFHIEEDGYEQLRSYLDTITHYFSSYEDSGEIIADIESRIAEIFLAKLKEGKQVVTLTDVKHLMTTMGSIHDFQAIEGDPIPETDAGYSEEESRHTDSWQTTDTYEAKKLYRDTKRKIIGGVAAGISNYFHLDPLWIRLVMILLLCDIFITTTVGILMFIGYIVGWIIIPPNDAVEEDLKTKKLYRNPDGRVISGICSGLATYFGVDVALIRLLFVLCLFLSFGTFLLIYFILWVITPEAKTITDKIQMQGEPVTLANIESNVKQSLKLDTEEEGILAKILLFPFRLISLILSGLGKAVGPFVLFLVEAIRVISGTIILLISITLLFVLFIITGVCFNISGYYQLWIPYLSGFPVEILHNSFPPLLFVSAFFTHFIPFFALLLAGISIMVKRRIGNALLGWSLLAIWLVAVAGLGLTLPVTIKDFSSEATHRVTETFPIGDEIMVLDLRETGMEGYQATTLQLIGSSGDELELVQKFKARGSSRQNAITNAQMASYTARFTDSVLTFDSNIQFKEEAVFRVQTLDMQLFIPYNKPFIIRENLKPILENTFNNRYSTHDLNGKIWIFNKEGLQCQTCSPKEKQQQSQEAPNSTAFNIDASDVNLAMSGVSRLLAEDFAVENANVKISGLSNATVPSQSLETSKSGLSNIENTHQKEKRKAEREEVSVFYRNTARIFYQAVLAKASIWVNKPQLQSF